MPILSLEHDVEVERPDKVVFPEVGATRQDVVDHHLTVADVMLPHLRDRPLLLVRYPEGLQEEGFYQKRAPPEWPNWIRRVRVETQEGPQVLPIAEETATLAFLVDQGTITLQPWLSSAEHLDLPDRMVFDFDPPHGPVADHFPSLCDGARSLADRLRALGGHPHFLLTGSKGLHVVVPLEPEASYGAVRTLAASLARDLVRERPDVFTLDRRAQRRDRRILVDTWRNAFGQTTVAPYSLRDTPRGPVATPVEERELEDPRLTSRRFTITNIARRLATRGDPWKDLDRRRVPLSRLVRRHRDAHSEASF